MGLLAALLLLYGLFCTTWFCSDGKTGRWHDPKWLAWLAAPVYMLHQFDEYALFYDYAGRKALFSDAVCINLGYPPYPACPLPLWHFWLINIVLSWLIIPFVATWAKRTPWMALAPWGVIFINALMHTASAVFTDSTRAGLFSSLILFLPASLWLARVGLENGFLTRRALVVIIAAGLMAHILLFAAFVSFRYGGATALFALDILALTLPLLCLLPAKRYFVDKR